MTEQAPVRPARVLVICCLSIFVVILDSSVVNVALPAIGHSLRSGKEELQWVVDGYTLALAGFLISSGVLADRGGRRRFFRYGLIFFGSSSLLCSVAPTIHVLIAARVLQGVGGSMLNPIALAIITSVYSEPARRAKALGVWGAVVGIAMALGPVFGGFLVDAVGWQSIFWINVPVCAVAVWATRHLPESFGKQARGLDARGQAFSVMAMFALVLTIIELPRRGLLSPWIGAAFACFVLCAWAAGHAMRRAESPFIDLRAFRSPSYAVANLAGFFGALGLGVVVFTVSLYLQLHIGESAVAAGAHLLPMAVGMFVFSSASGRAMAAFGPAPSLLFGGLGMVASGVVLAMGGASPTGSILVGAGLYGMGLGLVNAPISAMGAMGMGENAGAASGVVSTSRQLGMSVGVALAGAVADPGAGRIGPSWAMLCVCGAVVTATASMLWLRSRSAARQPS